MEPRRERRGDFRFQLHRRPPAFTCATLYAAGGVYGNPYALDAIQARASAEPSPPEIVFNGDFHYLDAGPAVFRAVDDRVRARHATQGNIEYALTAAVGGHRAGIVHGDPENLAGWRPALEAAEPQRPRIRDRAGFTGTPTTAGQVLDWFRRAEAEALCRTRTGLPYARDSRHPAGRYPVANNGCAGLPGFAGRRHGALTRLSVLPGVPGGSLYGLTTADLRFDALPVGYDHSRWVTHFPGTWPPGSPAHRNYHHRIEHGTWLTPGDAARGTVTCSG